MSAGEAANKNGALASAPFWSCLTSISGPAR
jgi:hypothetical protein